MDTLPTALPPTEDGRSGSLSSTDSTSPTLGDGASSSPLGSFGGIERALPSPAAGSGPTAVQRSASQRSYDASPDAMAAGTQDLASEEDATLDALRRYRQGLYSYTSSRFDRFKSDLERKDALDQHHPSRG